MSPAAKPIPKEQISGAEATQHVERLFISVLGRLPDSNATSALSTALQRGDISIIDIAEELLASDEFKRRGNVNGDGEAAQSELELRNLKAEDQVRRAFLLVLARNPTPAEIELHSKVLASDQLDALGLAAQLMMSVEPLNGADKPTVQPAATHVSSGPKRSAEDEASRAFELILGRKASQKDREAYSRALLNGDLDTLGMVRELLYSAEFNNRGGAAFSSPAYREALVTRLYNVILGRNPDDPGKNHFLSRLEKGENVITLCAGLIESIEFSNRVLLFADTVGNVLSCLATALLNRTLTDEERRYFVTLARSDNYIALFSAAFAKTKFSDAGPGELLPLCHEEIDAGLTKIYSGERLTNDAGSMDPLAELILRFDQTESLLRHAYHGAAKTGQLP